MTMRTRRRTTTRHSCFKWHMRSSVPIELCFFFLLILKDQISLLNGALYGSPKVPLWTFAKNVMTGSQLTKNGFFPQKNDVFSKNFTEKNTFLETSAPALKGHIVRHHLEKTRMFYLLKEKKQSLSCDKYQTTKKLKIQLHPRRKFT